MVDREVNGNFSVIVTVYGRPALQRGFAIMNVVVGILNKKVVEFPGSIEFSVQVFIVVSYATISEAIIFSPGGKSVVACKVDISRK